MDYYKEARKKLGQIHMLSGADLRVGGSVKMRIARLSARCRNSPNTDIQAESYLKLSQAVKIFREFIPQPIQNGMYR